MKDRDQTFAKLLTALMKEKRLSVANVAKVANVSKSKIQSWRAGSLPTDFKAVQRLARHFNLSMEFLLTGAEETNIDKKDVSIAEVFNLDEQIFNGYAKIIIQKLTPRNGKGDL